MKLVFKILDYLIALFMGSGTAWVVTLAVGRDWNMFLAMVAGMVIGTAVLLLSLLLFISVSTPFEIIPCGMVITMVAGMASGMAWVGNGPDAGVMISISAVFSLCTQLGFDLYNGTLKGDVPVDNGR